MKILFVSSQTATAAAGPNWSIPARVKAQSEFDDVYWININNTVMPHWLETGVFHHLSDINGKLRLENLPPKFQKPDMVLFEVPYFIPFLKFSKQLRKMGIPYIIVPRCSFTRQALNNHAKWKKKIAHWLLFNTFFKGAIAIQYLTEQEKHDSEPFICPRSFIIPNGINLPNISSKTFNNDGLKGLFIGRIDIYHKGLDLLVEAIIENASYLRNKKVTFDIYGPKNEDYLKLLQLTKDNNIKDIFILKGEISGNEKDRVLRNSDFFIMTSRFEGQPMAMLEALSYGLPCVASEGSYMDDIIEKSNAGIGCGVSVKDIGRAFHILIDNKDKLPLFSSAARSLAKKFDWNTQAKELHNIISQLIAQ